MTGPALPPQLLKLDYCQCKKKSCTDNRCACVKKNIVCTDLCSCSECHSSGNETEDHQVDNLEYSDDSESEDSSDCDDDN